MPTEAQLRRERDIRNDSPRTEKEKQELKERNKAWTKEQNEKVRCGECNKLEKRKNMEYKDTVSKGKRGNWLCCKTHTNHNPTQYPQNILAF